jgi:prepilin-type N-terminal cleavage/methylation domain-containing protein
MRTNMLKTSNRATRSSESGFTLVEALVAMVVLAVGITAVANLMVVGASSNSVGNAATASAAIASQELERLKAVEYNTLAVGGNLDADVPAAGLVPAFFRVDDVPGVGRIRTRWTVQALAGTPRIRFITIRAQGEGAMTGARSRAQFTVFRSCTSTTIGCP